MYLGGGLKRKKHRRNHRGKQAGSRFVLLLVLDSKKSFSRTKDEYKDDYLR
jgi:hypothetical protein